MVPGQLLPALPGELEGDPPHPLPYLQQSLSNATAKLEPAGDQRGDRGEAGHQGRGRDLGGVALWQGEGDRPPDGGHPTRNGGLAARLRALGLRESGQGQGHRGRPVQPDEVGSHFGHGAAQRGLCEGVQGVRWVGMSEQAMNGRERAMVALARADVYNFLAAVYAAPPTREMVDRLFDRTLGEALAGFETARPHLMGLEQELVGAGAEELAEARAVEHRRLCVGPGAGYVPPYQSVYTDRQTIELCGMPHSGVQPRAKT